MFLLVTTGSDCKICIDGKKLTVGFGKELGDEDLAGHEESPILLERQKRFHEKEKLIQNTIFQFSTYNLNDTFETLNNDVNSLRRTNLLNVVSILSGRCKELRQQAVKSKLAVSNLMTQVQGEWMKSELKGCISYIQTKLLRINSCIEKLIKCIDDIGYTVSVLNGTQ